MVFLFDASCPGKPLLLLLLLLQRSAAAGAAAGVKQFTD